MSARAIAAATGAVMVNPQKEANDRTAEQNQR